jgi:hypothetical protein
MSSIPEFTGAERWVVESTLKERYGSAPALEPGEAELQLDPASEAVTPCPALYWQAQGAGFALFKLGPSRFRGMFFYSVHDQYDLGDREYDEIAECVSVLLKLQEEHAAHRADLAPDAESSQLGEAFANRIIDF